MSLRKNIYWRLCGGGLVTWLLLMSGCRPVYAGCASGCGATWAKEGWATWYSAQSCRKEGNSGVTASGRRLEDRALWCALPERPPAGPGGRRAWGRRVRITNRLTGKSIVCEQWDVGPGKKARRRVVVVDLTPGAMRALAGAAGIRKGRVPVKVVRED